MCTSTLQTLRNRTGLTQEQVAEKMGVSTNTIQNWEGTGNIKKDQLHQLLDLYRVDRDTRNKVVLDLFGRNETKTVDDSGYGNIPVFLLKDHQDIIDHMMEINLNPEEMEVFGYSQYVNTHELHFHDYGTQTLGSWPLEYSFFSDHGGFFSTQKRLQKIDEVLKRYTLDEIEDANSGEWKNDRYSNYSIRNKVYEYGIAHPDTGFSLKKQSKEDILDYLGIGDLANICTSIGSGILLASNGSYHKDVLVPSHGRHTFVWKTYDEVPYLDLPKYYEKFIYIEESESTNQDYLRHKAQYEKDLTAYQEHPSLYDRQPKFKHSFDYTLKLTELGEKVLHWLDGK